MSTCAVPFADEDTEQGPSKAAQRVSGEVGVEQEPEPMEGSSSFASQGASGSLLLCILLLGARCRSPSAEATLS